MLTYKVMNRDQHSVTVSEDLLDAFGAYARQTPTKRGTKRTADHMSFAMANTARCVISIHPLRHACSVGGHSPAVAASDESRYLYVWSHIALRPVR